MKRFVTNFFEHSQIPVFLFDEHGNCLDANRFACDLLGYVKKKITTLNISNFIVKRDNASAEANPEQIKHTDLQGSFEFIRNKKPNLTLTLFSTLIPEGGLTFVIETYPETNSSRKLIQSEAQLKRITETIGEGVIVFNKKSVITFANRGLSVIFGHDIETMQGSDVTMLMPLKQRKKFKKSIKQKNGVEITKLAGKLSRFQGLHKKGFVFPVEIRLNEIQLPGSDHIYIGAIRDISRSLERERKLHLIESRLAKSQEISSLGSWGWDLVTDEIFWTDQTFRIYGLPAKTESIGLSDFIGRIYQADKQRVSRAIQGSISKGEPYFIEHRIIRPSGEERIVRQIGEVTFNAEKKPIFFDGTIQDITVEREERRRLDLLAKVFEKSLEAVIVVDENINIIEVNPSFESMTGYTFEQVKGRNPSLLSSGRHPQDFYDNLWERIRDVGYWEGEIWDRKKNGAIYASQVNIVKFEDELDQKTRYLAVFADITAFKESEKKLKQLAFYDPLTSLPNRSFFTQELDHNLVFCVRNKLQLALLFLDLDGFKAVNDSMGHAAGDEVLIQVGKLLSSTTRESDYTARLGGDEFVISILNVKSPQDAAMVAKKIISKFKTPFIVQGQEIFLGVSIGISIFPTDGTSAGKLLQHADSAMYYAKNEGKGRYRFYAAEMEVAARKRMLLETNLFHALERDQFSVFYQPIVDARNGEICGAEALVRWHHPKEGLVPPGEFIPVAEENGLILQIDHFVLETACRQLNKWNKKLNKEIYISVNYSQLHFQKGNSADIIFEILRETNSKPENLTIEITEKHLSDETSETIKQLSKMKDKNVRISIDDFGTGYSSLRYLKQMPLSELKMDGIFVSDVADDSSIAKSILDLASNLNLMVVAEGVETKKQVLKLLELDCNMMQGHYFCEPLSLENFEKLLADGVHLQNLADK